MERKYTADFIAGINEALKSIEITVQSGKPVTQAEIDLNRNHWNSQPVHAPTQTEIERFDVASKAAQMRVLKTETVAAGEAIKNIVNGINELPVAFEKLAEKLSVLKN